MRKCYIQPFAYCRLLTPWLFVQRLRRTDFSFLLDDPNAHVSREHGQSGERLADEKQAQADRENPAGEK